MRKHKQTFIDSQTGEEMKSTWLARGGLGLLAGGGVGLTYGLLYGWIVGWLFGIGLGLVYGLMVGLVVGLGKLGFPQMHDRIARTQHRRRQRVLRSREHAEVPDGALSRAQPPVEPTPTDAALSRTDTTDEKDHLTTATEEETTEGVVEVEGTT